MNRKLGSVHAAVAVTSIDLRVLTGVVLSVPHLADHIALPFDRKHCAAFKRSLGTFYMTIQVKLYIIPPKSGLRSKEVRLDSRIWHTAG
jgi:hypothetical protein